MAPAPAHAYGLEVGSEAVGEVAAPSLQELCPISDQTLHLWDLNMDGA